MVTLFDIPLSPYAQKVKMALLEKGVGFESKVPDLDEPDAEFVALSPRLEVPAFIHGDARLFDSSIIIEYTRREYRDHRLDWMLRSGGLDIVIDGIRKGTIRFSLDF